MKFEIFKLYLTLVRGGRHKCRDLAQDLEVSERTVYRYIETLCQAGVPIFSFRGKDGGVEIGKNHNIFAQFFTHPEQHFIIELLKDNNSTIAKNILQKICP